MQKIKTILAIERPRGQHFVGDGFKVSQYLPGYGKTMNSEDSPFLMLDYNAPWKVEPQKNGHIPGVGFHPHRWFETVTCVFSGSIDHKDLHGNSGTIGKNEVQWMTAGSGIIHQEYMNAQFAQEGGIQHLLQLWVNLPREKKLCPPKYQSITQDQIPSMQQNGVLLRCIAGSIDGISWPAETQSPLELYDISWIHGSSKILQFPTGFTCNILVIEGSVLLEQQEVSAGDFLKFSRQGSEVSIEFWANGGRIFCMAWEPFHDPVVQDGPFVMTNKQEIWEAWQDFHSGKFH
jgi:quercetin 2,3-dioxygenase